MTAAKERLAHLLGLPGNRITYEQARGLLDHPDPAVRAELATRRDLDPEILFYLARDPETGVRLALANNDTTPHKASLVLAADDDADVRSGLAERIAQLIPGLGPDQQDKAWRTVHQVLTLLARDQLPRVRAALSEALKFLPNAPRDVILMLAYDGEASVASPVLEFSPVLSDDDLLAVIRSSPLSSSLMAISRRVNVGEEVCNAIVGSGDVGAITALLRNQSSQVREETLDAIIDAAPGQASWHEPLVHRRNLSNKAALRIAEFVADSLLQVLASRRDMDPVTLASLSFIVREKLRQDRGGGLGADSGEGLTPENLNIARHQVEALAKSGNLETGHVLHLAAQGSTAIVVMAISRLADLPVEAVIEVVRTRSAKGMLAVAWAADFTAEEAAQLQVKVAKVPPDAIIRPRAGGGFDATEAELECQLDMYQEAARAAQ
jgi:hypothetical protein